ncbi:MAG: 6-carboxytetrahydropterin synthase QueD [Bacteroidales bacterium]|jgi:6-pyruvoyltetrahydropterin/6-carboxytetrahydropterin synthase|nr:6-carboxytetrahydropterin synthase QueD [Bacteroidales bacterium]
MKLLLTKKCSFEMAHALEEYDGKCANLHGHSYHLEVTVEGAVPAAGDGLAGSGMVMDFHSLKEIVQETVVARYDHALVLKEGSRYLTGAVAAGNLVTVPFNPTAENLLLHFAALLRPQLPEGTRLHSLRLSETDSSVAELQL